MGGALKPHNVRYIMQRSEARQRAATAKVREARMTPEERIALEEDAHQKARELLAKIGM